MKVTVKITKTVEEEVELNLDFPLYLKYELDSDFKQHYILTKLEENGDFIELSYDKAYRDKDPTFEITKGKRSNPMYYYKEYFGKATYGDYAYSNDSHEFDKLFSEIKQTLE